MDDLIANIHKYFGANVPPKFPDVPPEWRSSETYEETSYFDGKTWAELKVGDFDTYTCCHSFFPDNCALYYLGANMYWECASGQFWTDAMDRYLMDLTLLNYLPSKYPGPIFRIAQQWAAMNSDQRSTLMAYLDQVAKQAVIDVEAVQGMVRGVQGALKRL